MTFFAGDRLAAADLNAAFAALPQGIIARHTRNTTSLSGVGATETPFIRMDNIPIRNGYSYEIIAPRLVLTTTATTTIGAVRLRGSTSGNATIASAGIDGAEVRPATPVDTSNVPEQQIIGVYHSATTGSLSVLLSIIRVAGAGTVGLFSTVNIPMYVKEIGITPVDAGTDL